MVREARAPKRLATNGNKASRQELTAWCGGSRIRFNSSGEARQAKFLS
jgi:hypothetical protein